ncbi:MAG: aa3-type cytochrome c oxidase subunit IV [Sphingomonadales bacterium]|nr:aa3-type cytochrome c oxidase subunit IV [Sphingomonadales bacterium]PIX65364.1 MAG: aa3-type cytochrome c oxidase subunit IV [Sphingomonadales bacterium CG_4_10_14_3_um_filter_58_15]NCO49284.1 aa3-type cytochrome c oxidase subunit IV [Sphingomonadales bacterium]NCO99456.1 aa3-type cytochrome c oxidase subunit IV [Sphingomonadales bacterium]NCP27834.1 aa3-type cytochrome c oxidase subunit IV [Sphingomonadales bacterium]
MTTNNELGTAQETYAKFLSMLKVGTIATAVVAILVVILIS